MIGLNARQLKNKTFVTRTLKKATKIAQQQHDKFFSSILEMEEFHEEINIEKDTVVYRDFHLFNDAGVKELNSYRLSIKEIK